MATKDSESDETATDEARDAEATASREADEESEADAEDAQSDAESEHESEDSDDDGEEDSDEAASDEADSDEAASDEGASDEEEASEADAEAKPAAKKGATRADRKAKKREGLTPGARLAAAKAAKAARKAAKRGKEIKAQDPMAQVRESAVAQQAARAGTWMRENRGAVIAALAVVVLGLGGWIGWTYYTDKQAAEAGALLEDALEIAGAQIRAEDAPEPEGEDEDEPTFPTAQARSEAAVRAFRRVVSQYPDSDAAPWAQLGEATALLELGRNEQARGAYDAAIRRSDGNSLIVWRALEGKAFTHEAEQEWDQAIALYRELQSLDGRRFEPIAKYHLGRMQLAKGQRREATETFRALVENLREADDNEQAQDFAYVLAQAEVRLRELDPSAAPPPTPSFDGFGLPPGAGGAGDITQEQLQELIRRMQEQQGGGGLE